MIETTKPGAKMLLFVDDRVFGERVRRQARRVGLTVMSCYNFSDFWQIVMSHTDELRGLVLDQRHVTPVAACPAYQRVADLPVIVTGKGPGGPALPFTNAAFLPKGYGAAAIVQSVVARSASLG